MTALFNDTDANKRAIVEPLIANAAFMAVTLEDLQAAINTDGVVDTYRNGENQNGVKTSAALQAYNSTLKNYNTVIKQLYALVPYEKPQAKIAELQDDTPKETEEERTARINAEIERAAAWQREQWAKEGRKPI